MQVLAELRSKINHFSTEDGISYHLMLVYLITRQHLGCALCILDQKLQSS
jgi:hypothetical protein